MEVRGEVGTDCWHCEMLEFEVVAMEPCFEIEAPFLRVVRRAESALAERNSLYTSSRFEKFQRACFRSHLNPLGIQLYK